MRHCITIDVPEPSSDIWVGPATLSVDGHTIVRAFRPSLVIASSGQTLVNYWLFKGCFPPGSVGTNVWEAQRLVASGAGTTRHQWLVKMVSGLGPIGVEMLMCEEWSDAGCLSCPKPFLRPSPMSSLVPHPLEFGQLASQAGLPKWLTRTTSLWLTHIITQYLDEWHSGKPKPMESPIKVLG